MYLFGIHLDEQEPIKKSFRSIYGLGRVRLSHVFSKLGYSSETSLEDLTDLELKKMILFLSENYSLGDGLRKQERSDIKRLILINSYRGFRHRYGLPVRGQRTHSNGQTSKKLFLKSNAICG